MEEELGSIPIRLEEEEEEGWSPPVKKHNLGFVQTNVPEREEEEEQQRRPKVNEAYADLIHALAEERSMILNNEKLTGKEKQALLDENRKTLVVANGGSVRKTDSVVYGILVFGGVVLIALSLLTVFAGLPSEVTLAFVGTVLGGTIATIAQKLGKL